MGKKLETVKLVVSLEKTARKTKKALWEDLAERLQSPRRNKVAVNLEKLNRIASTAKGKTLLIPGKVLAQGELNEKTIIVAISASEEAKKKIKAKGEFITLKEFVEKGAKADLSKVIIVK